MHAASHEDLLEGLDAIVWEADPHTFQFTYVSRGAERLLGYSLEHWLGTPQFWVDLLHPDDREQAVEFCRSAVRNCQDHEFEYRMIAADGRVLWIRDIVRVVCDSAGGASGLRGVMLDVSDRKQAESAWHRQDRFTRALIEHTLDIITVIDRDGAILYTSPSSERVFGRAPASRAGHSIFDDVHPNDVAAARQALRAAMTSRQPTPLLRIRCRHADGSWRVLEVIGRLFVDGGRDLVIVNSRDITERIALEDRVRHAQRLDALGKLTSAVAHDFNNVLFAIRGYANVGLEAPDLGTARRDLEEVLKAADIGTALTSQLLAFGERRPLPVEVIDVHATLQSHLRLVRRLTGPSVRFTSRFEAPLSRVRLQKGQLEQIVINLAVNARHAMPDGGDLRITTRLDPWGASMPDGTFGDFILEIADTGVGIPAEIIDQIFDPYFTTRPPGQSTGLGLSTVYGIVKDAGGTITVQSNLGEGATFTIKLPLASGNS
jgi:PAS domain S-box-containing protein